MKKWYSIGLLLLLLALVGTMVVACGEKAATTTTAAPTTAPPTTAPPTTAAPTETTVAAGGDAIGVYFEDLGNNVVKLTDVPAPGMAFPISTSGDFAATIEAFDASGASLGLLTTETGELDYSSVADTVAKIVVTASTGTAYEYEVPAADGAAAEAGIVFTDQGSGKVFIEVIPGPGMRFPVSTEGGFAQKIEAFDAAGASLGLVELPEAAAGILDYSGIAGIAKLIVTDVPHGNVEYEYLIP
jgi:hypothetical protein